MKYNCVSCNYSTQRKSSFTVHCNSLKHALISEKYNNDNKQIKENSYICNHCDHKFKKMDSLTKHKKACIDAKLNAYKINEETLLEKINKLEKEVAYYKDVVKEIIKKI